jgi:hypothetical protein
MKAFRAMCESYYNYENGGEYENIKKEVVGLFKASMQDENIAISRGFNMAFGALSK